MAEPVGQSAMSRIERTGSRVVDRWRVHYISPEGEGMGTETVHFTRLGARFSRWLWR